MELTKVLGFTSNNRNSFVSHPETGNIIYVAGCVVVLVDTETGHQKYLIANSKQTITTLAISDDGKLLATADCCGEGQQQQHQQVNIRIWSIHSTDNPDGQQLISAVEEVSSFLGHSNELSCMAFSPNSELLVSAGSRQDLSLVVWQWRKGLKLAEHKLSTKARSISFAADGSYFVTVGEAHVNYWHINPSSNPGDINWQSHGDELGRESISVSITCRAATLGSNYKDASFCDVRCGRGESGSGKTFCITKQGFLCELLDERRLLHKWVDLKTSGANCLTIGGDDLIVVGCANGVVRCFSASELKFIRNLPRPHQLGTDIANKKRASTQSAMANYPSLIGVSCQSSSSDEYTISCLYNDRSIYVWCSDSLGTNANKKYSALYHSSCIWGIDVYPTTTTDENKPLLAQGSFVTCSSDDTLRIWNCVQGMSQNEAHIYGANVFSDDSLKIIFTDPAHKYLCDLDCVAGDQKVTNNYDSNEGLRCLKLSPDGKHLAVGSRSGTIRVFDFARDCELKSIAAHDAEVLCLEYSDPNIFDGYYYLASSSRDKLIHLFDAARDYQFLQTIDDHSSSITALRFVYNRTDDCLQLISCGTDQKIVFRKGKSSIDSDDEHEDRKLTFVSQRIIEGRTTFYDMEVDCESSCLMTACQDRMIRLFNVGQVKYQSGFKGSNSSEGTIIRLALDPSCTFLAASCTDKSVSIYDYQRGENVATISHGLSDLVTDMKFSLDGRYLIACSGNGCIYIWSSPAEVANASSYLVGTADQHGATVPGHKQQQQHDWSNPTSDPYYSYSDDTSIQRQQQTLGRYQVQKVSNIGSDCNANEGAIRQDGDDDDDDQRTLRGEDDGQSSNRYARSQRSTSSAHRTSRDSGLVSNMAKYFQSRENLDKISSRQRYIHDSLFSTSGRRRSAVDGNASISGRFVNHTENVAPHMLADDESRSMRAKSLSRLSTGHVNPPPGTSGRRRADSSGDERSSADEDDSTSNPTNQKSATLNSRQARRDTGAGCRTQTTGDESYRSAARRRQTDDCMPVPRIRSSRSECNLKLNQRCSAAGDDADENSFERLNYANSSETTSAPITYCQRLDLTKLDPNRVQISHELCQHIVEELRLVSKFATRLHQRLHSGGSRNLANFMSRGIHNSLDILSIVPPRALVQQQFRSQANLSASARQSATTSSKQQLMNEPIAAVATTRRSSIGSMVGVNNVIGSAASSSSGSSRVHQHPTEQQIGSERRNSSADHQGQQRQLRQVEDNHSQLGHGSLHSRATATKASTAVSAKVFADQQQLASVTKQQQSCSGANRNMNIDQVLEAYSDRLFKMVQRRMECNNTTATSPLAGRAGELANSSRSKQTNR